MARIPEHEIERLKKEISVERLAEARGIKLTRHGADLLGKRQVPQRPDAVAGHLPTRGRTSGTAWAHPRGGTAIDWIMRTRTTTSVMQSNSQSRSSSLSSVQTNQ